MRNAFILLIEAKSDTGKFKPPEEIGLPLPHQTFKFFTYIGNIRDS